MGNTKSTELHAGNLTNSSTTTSKFFGIVNFGNTCYLNSVFQALYHCKAFRDHLLEYSHELYKELYDQNADDVDIGDGDDTDQPQPTLLSLLAELFDHISNNEEQNGTLEPKDFIECVQQRNGMFVGTQHQDAHEFLHFLLSDLSETINEHRERQQQQQKVASDPNFIEDLFGGVFTNRMQCLRCDTISSRDEKFMDLSVDISNHCSLSHCLSQFGRRELLFADCKFRCSECQSLQEAHKWLQVKRQPRVLICHLKRFKYTETMEFKKLCYRVCFSQYLRLPNLVEDLEPCLYELFAVVVHVGSGSSHGHYVCVVRQGSIWYLYDDHIIHQLEHDCLHHFFGSVHDPDHNDGYLLFFQQVS